MPPRLKRILNTLSSQRLLSTCWRHASIKAKGFFFCFFNHKLLWFLRPAHKNLLCYCQQKYEEPHTRFFGMHVCFRARERSPSNGDGRESEHKKKTPKQPTKKKQSRQSGVKIQMAEQQRLKHLSLSLLAQLFMAQQGFVSLTSQISSSFSLSYPPPPPSDPFTHTPP